MMDDNPFVSIITVNYNGKEYLADLFGSLLKLNYPLDKLELILVDNGSIDDSIKFVIETFPQVRILKNDLNNYCTSNNLGIKSAKGEFIALINNDLRFDKDWLIELIKVIAQNEKIGMVSGKILFPDGKLQGTGHLELPNFYWLDRGFGEEDKGQYDESDEVPSISHCAVLYRKRCLDEAGLLDEDFNMFMEDVDMSVRAREKGWRLKYAPKGVTYHKLHGTMDDRMVDFVCERNRLLLIAKHYPRKLKDALLGKGYFNQDEFVRILPDVFAKLIKHHNQETIISILPDIFEGLHKILNINREDLLQKNSALKQEIGRIYSSEAYRFIANPFVKYIFPAIKNIMNIKMSLRLKGRSGRISFARFLTESVYAQYGESNIYLLKVTNDNRTGEKIKIGLRIHNNNDPDCVEEEYDFFSTEAYLPPKESLSLKLDYNWKDRSIFYMPDKISEVAAHGKDGPHANDVYCLKAIIFDPDDKMIDSFEIFQRLKR